MTRAAWLVQIVLAVLFTGTGIMKLTIPKDQLVARGLRWAVDYSPPSIRLIGAAELAGAVGLIVSAATGIQPRLTSVAAAGLTALMARAAVTHAQRREPHLMQIGLGLLAGWVAYVRWRGASRHGSAPGRGSPAGADPGTTS